MVHFFLFQVSRMKKLKFFLIGIFSLFLISCSNRTSCEGKQNLKNNWSERLQYVGVVIEDDEYHIWGSSPIWGNDGKVHVFAARIPAETGFYKWWATSQIAHYVSDQPEGPFKFVEVLLEPGQTAPGSWDQGTQHNPTITKIDDLYVLSYHSGMGTLEDRKRPTMRIGMMIASDINGPWQKLGKILDTPTSGESDVVPPGYEGGTDNPALIRHPDGRYFLYYRLKFSGMEGGNTYGVAIADQLEGPYTHYPSRVVNNPTYIEDPYVFVCDSLFYMLITDAKSRGGLLLSSEDGLHFDYREAVRAYGELSDYVPADKMPAPLPDMPGGSFERPQLLLRDGFPTHLYAPSGVNMNGGKNSCCYLFKILKT